MNKDLIIISSGVGVGASPDARPISAVNPNNPRKKRTKMMRLQNMTAAIVGGSSSSSIIPPITTKPKYPKKPDPSAPKITRPCTECGKKFWSWKALFGHMRCHPERPWRGINPPGGLSLSLTTSTDEERYVASCLLMLASGAPRAPDYNYEGMSQLSQPPGWFECTSCKKVFGSHQALGGHRASHKNVKGCFAITRNDGSESEDVESHQFGEQHKCSVCSRVFSSGQALGGHKRCHWEKEDEAGASTFVFSHMFDLNLPAPQDQEYSSCSNVGLDLRLGL